MNEEEMAEAVKIDKELYQYITEESLDDFLSILYWVSNPEGNYIEEFDRKMKNGGITVNEEYQNQLIETGREVPGIDLRTGLYGLEYAAAGFFSAGCLFYDEEEWDKAIANFAKAIELRPRHVFAYSMKAQAHHKKKEYLLSAAEMDNSILLNPYGISRRTGQPIPGLEERGEGLIEDLKDTLVHSYYIKGRSYYHLEMKDKALEALNQALEIDPEYMIALDGRLSIFMESGRWKEAVKDCDKLLEEDYNAVKVLQYRGICYRELEKFRKAVSDFTTAIALDTDLTYAFAQRGLCYFRSLYFEKAIIDFTEALKRGLNEECYYYRARSFYHLGEYDKSIADFDKALSFDPDNENIIMLRNQSIDDKKRGVIMGNRRKNRKGEYIPIPEI